MALVLESASAAGSEIRHPTYTAFGSSASATEDVDFIDELKHGMSVLLHVKIGKLEPASMRLDEETGKLVVKTNREGWFSCCHCHNRLYELGPEELEPVPLRVHTRQLNRSVSVVNGGDAHLVKRMLQRSLSLLRRYPKAEAIDITFSTAEMEERLRLWAQKELSVKTPTTSRRSSTRVLSALTGNPPSDASDNETAVSEDSPHQERKRQQPRQPRGEKDQLPPAPARSASIHPAQQQQQTRLERRHSLNPFKQQSQRMSHRRGSTGTDRLSGGGGGDGAAAAAAGMETSSVGSGGGGGGGRGGSEGGFVRDRVRSMGRDIEDDGSSENTSWSWKEPPVLRRMQTSRTAGRSRSRPRGVSDAGVAASGEQPSFTEEGEGEEPETPQFDRAVSVSRGMDRRKGQEPEERDFWDPLGLMSTVTPQTPLAAKTTPSGQRSGEWSTRKSTTPAGTPRESRGRDKKPKDLNTE